MAKTLEFKGIGKSYPGVRALDNVTFKAEGGKVSFRGFRGRYRLTWKDASGKKQSKLVDVK